MNEKILEIGKLIRTFFRHFPDGTLTADLIRNSITIDFWEILNIFEYFEKNGVLKGSELGSNDVVTESGWEQVLRSILESLESEELKQVKPSKTGTSVFKAEVYRVVIGSPGDVGQEGEKARASINEWNEHNSKTTSKVLLPVMWEHHATPEM